MESDRIVHALTREQGLVCAIAKGAHKSRRRFPGALEPFSEVLMHVHRGRGSGLQRIEQARLLNAHMPLRQDIHLMGYACVLLEIAKENLGQQDPAPEVYACLKNALDGLSGSTRWFNLWCTSLMDMLRHIGYGLRPDSFAPAGMQEGLASSLSVGPEARSFMERAPGLTGEVLSRISLSARAKTEITLFLLDVCSRVTPRPLSTAVFLAKLLDLDMKQ